MKTSRTFRAITFPVQGAWLVGFLTIVFLGLSARPVSAQTVNNWTIVDDTTASIDYEGTTWQTANWSGYIDNTAHYTWQQDSVKYTFKGTGIKWIAATNTDHGEANVYLDGGFQKMVDLYSASSVNQVVVYADSALNDGVHTIQIIVLSQHDANASGSFVDVDAFDVASMGTDSTMDMIMWYDIDDGPEINTRPDSGWWPLYPGYPNNPTTNWTIVDDTTGSIDYEGTTWQTANWSGYIDNTAHYTWQRDSVKYTFTGTGIEWIAATNADHGEANVYLDGVYQKTVDLYSSTGVTQVVVYADSGLSDAEHTIQIVALSEHDANASGSFVDIDAFEVGSLGDSGPWRSTTPLLGLYSSQDSAVITQHAYWIRALGCNALVCDLTNSSPVAPGEGSYAGGVNEAFEMVMKTLAGINEFDAPCAYPAIRLSGTDYNSLDSMLDIMYSIYEEYPSKWYKLDDGTVNKDKPFIEIFADWSLLNQWATSGVPFNDSRFNIRWTNGYLLSQPSITQLDNNNVHYIPGNVPYWLFVENTPDPSKGSGYYEPVYKQTPDGSGVEQMITWASVSLGGDNWDGLRNTIGGKTPIERYTEPVFNLNPKVLLVCRFNYPISWPAEPQEGLSLNNSTHIEPNVDWGFLEFNDVSNELYSVRGWVKDAPPKPAEESFDNSNSVLKISLTGYPLEYRISNNDSLSGAQWTFLNVGQGGIKIGPAIDESKPIYLQTENSFGESPIATIDLTSKEQDNVGQDKNGTPTKFALSQNYPNPFNPTTEIRYSVPKNGFVTLKVYNVLGQEVAALFSGMQRPGNYTATFNASSLASGVYFYTLHQGSNLITKKLLLLK